MGPGSETVSSSQFHTVTMKNPGFVFVEEGMM